MSTGKLYPAQAANKNGMLRVSDTPSHELYWQEYGNPKGDPVMVLHGGPGGGSPPLYAQFFDPDYYRVILFDQRGAGKSMPAASLENNTTQHLIEDIGKLRDELKIENKMHLFGGSWGSTLSLAYAIEHPDTVKSMTLRGIFLCREQDLHFLYQGDAADPGNSNLMGTGRFFPEAWAEYVDFIPEKERGDMIAAYHKRHTSSDEEVKLEAAKRWSVWEASTSYLVQRPDIKEAFADASFALKFARIESHYFMNGGFLDKNGSRGQNHIIENIDKIAHIPTEIVHGRYDVVCPLNQATELHAAWAAVAGGKTPPLHIISTAGHSAKEPGIRDKLVEVTDRFRTLQKP